MKELLLEGGVAGHLAHLYDNRSLTFNKMAKNLSMASSGELEGTEKTDGFNVYLGFKDGEARAARNKTNMRDGGMNAAALSAREFKGGEAIRRAYLDAFDSFESAVASLNPQEKEAIFTEYVSLPKKHLNDFFNFFFKNKFDTMMIDMSNPPFDFYHNFNPVEFGKT